MLNPFTRILWKAVRQRDRLSLPASILLPECSEAYICIDDSLIEIGTCVNLEYLNDIQGFNRCEKHYNPEIEGDSSSCQECINYRDKHL